MGRDVGKSGSKIAAEVDGQRADEVDLVIVPLVDVVREELHRHRLPTGEKEQLAGVYGVVEIKARRAVMHDGPGPGSWQVMTSSSASRLLAVTPNCIPPRASSSCAARCSRSS